MQHSSDRFIGLAQLFFEIKQIIRSHVPGGPAHDPNEWMRKEVMRHIATKGRLGMKEIAAFLHITAPSATSLVSRLEREGLLRRLPREDDKRVVRVALTAAGEKTVRRYEKKAASIMREVFGRLGPEELDDLEAAMRRVSELHAPPQSAIMKAHDRSRTQSRKGS